MADTSVLSAEGVRARFGWRAERRPEPGFGHVLAAAAGSFLVFATISLVAEIAGSDDKQLPGILFSVALLAIGIYGGMQLAGPIRSACVTVLVLTTPLLWFYVFFGDQDGGRGSVRAIYLLTLAVYAVLALIAWTKGRGIMIALVLVVFTAWVLFEIGGDAGGAAPFQDQISQTQSPFTSGQPDSGLLFGESSDTSTETSIASLVLGLLYLAAAWRLDRLQLRGLATPFIAVGAIFSILGAISLGSEESQIVGGLCAAASGAAVGIIGGLGQDRRGTTWIGVLFVKFGLLTVAEDITDDSLALAGLFALFAVGLAVIAIYAAKQFNEHVDGDVNAGTVTAGTAVTT